MSVHARRWHFDWSSPVEIVVTERVSELLDLGFGKVGLLHGNEEVSWSHAALRASYREEEEIEFLALCICRRIFD